MRIFAIFLFVTYMSTLVAVAQTPRRTPSHAQTPTTAKGSAPVPTPVRDCYDNTPFTESVSVLPQKYCGVDVKRMIRAIEESPLLAKKSEFETTSAYQARLVSFETSSFSPGLHPTDELGIVLKQSEVGEASSPIEVRYDADAQQFDIKIKFSPRRLYLVPGTPTMNVLQLHTEINDSKDYVASNAMGAKIDVHETDSETQGLAMSEEQWLFDRSGGELRSRFADTVVHLKIEPAKAAELKSSVALVLVVRPNDPWVAQDVLSHDPTIDDPYKLLDDQHLLVSMPKALLIFDKRTGEILSRIDSISVEKQYALALNLRVMCHATGMLHITVDGKDNFVLCTPDISAQVLRASKLIEVKTDAEDTLNAVSFELNGKSYIPTWIKHVNTYGSTSFFQSASFDVVAQ